jgi:hypothetical protein
VDYKAAREAGNHFMKKIFISYTIPPLGSVKRRPSGREFGVLQ